MRINDQEFNRLTALKAIRRAEPIARTELPGLTGLSGGTITEVTADLVRRRILIEEKLPAQGRGRPRVVLRMNPDGAHLVGAFMSVDDQLVVEIINLRGDSVFTRTTKMSPTTTLEALAGEIATIIDATIAASPFRKSDMHRVGISLPAILDNVTGTVYWLFVYPNQTAPVGALIEQQLQLPVAIDNSANVMARGYHWFGNDPHLDDFTFIILDTGMASARYVGGMLKGGAHGINPELGHIKVALEPAHECYCGGSGCVATYSTVWGITTRICEQRGEQTPYYTALPELFRRFVAEARAGDVDAQKIFDSAGHQLGLAMASHINASDPGRIIVMCSEPSLWEMISIPFHAALKKNALPALYERTPVEVMSLNESELMWKGAAALVLEQLYRLPR